MITALGIIALTIGHFTQGASFTPKLAADLEGGTQLILTPKLQEGADAREVSQDDMNQAIKIIRQRIDASGVAEAEISTLGSNNIVVTIPGEADEQMLQLVRSSALMRFRPVLAVSQDPRPFDAIVSEQNLLQQSNSPQSGKNPEISMDSAIAQLTGLGKGQKKDNNSSYAWITEDVARSFLELDCTKPSSLIQEEVDDPTLPYSACQVDGKGKYLMGPVDLEGTDLKSATAGPEYTNTNPPQPTGFYAVNLEFNAAGTKTFAEVSNRLVGFKETDPTRNRFAIVLDGNVLIAPSMNVPIVDGRAQITGGYTASQATATANQLKFGSLPLNFEVQSEQQISATLGSTHLEKGLWAGIIGLLLVVLYLAWQYRALSLLATGSLVVAAILVYLLITILSWTMGYRLSLPGVAGLIIAIGITADSFIVYFERIRDEVRDGRPLQAAVDEGWYRAKRTILISDTVNLVAAIVLYVLAVGGVQGFAFTLGLTTVIDLVVVFMFTHPMMQLLVGTEFFGSGHKMSGLDPEHLGAKSGFVYQGRGRVKNGSGKKQLKAIADTVDPAQKESVKVSTTEFVESKKTSADGEQLSLAERRRQARLAQTATVTIEESKEESEEARG